MSQKNSFILGTLFCCIVSGLAFAQDFGPTPGPGGPDPAQGQQREGFGGPPMERTFHDKQFGRWWNNPEMAQKLGITDQQKKQMDDIFLQHRLKLIDLNATLDKQETLLHPMIEADQPDEAKILAQIDAVAQARAELEKANARMLFDIRKTLTPDQWQKLKAMRSEHRDKMMMRDGRGGPGDRGGPGGQGGPGGPNGWHKGHRPPPPDGAAPPPPSGQTPPQPPSSEE
jgi:Spy/CpxP family protein refolding chaperone